MPHSALTHPGLVAGFILASLLPALAFEGRYRTPANSMTIRPTGSGLFKVDAEISSSRCVGVISARGRLQGDRLVAEAKEDGEVCRLEISRKGRGIEVSESGQCSLFHGANCNYVGTYSPR